MRDRPDAWHVPSGWNGVDWSFYIVPCPDNIDYKAALHGAVLLLAEPDNWDETTGDVLEPVKAFSVSNVEMIMLDDIFNQMISNQQNMIVQLSRIADGLETPDGEGGVVDIASILFDLLPILLAGNVELANIAVSSGGSSGQIAQLESMANSLGLVATHALTNRLSLEALSSNMASLAAIMQHFVYSKHDENTTELVNAILASTSSRATDSFATKPEFVIPIESSDVSITWVNSTGSRQFAGFDVETFTSGGYVQLQFTPSFVPRFLTWLLSAAVTNNDNSILTVEIQNRNSFQFVPLTSVENAGSIIFEADTVPSTYVSSAGLVTMRLLPPANGDNWFIGGDVWLDTSPEKPRVVIDTGNDIGVMSGGGWIENAGIWIVAPEYPTVVESTAVKGASRLSVNWSNVFSEGSILVETFAEGVSVESYPIDPTAGTYTILDAIDEAWDTVRVTITNAVKQEINDLVVWALTS